MLHVVAWNVPFHPVKCCILSNGMLHSVAWNAVSKGMQHSVIWNVAFRGMLHSVAWNTAFRFVECCIHHEGLQFFFTNPLGAVRAQHRHLPIGVRTSAGTLIGLFTYSPN